MTHFQIDFEVLILQFELYFKTENNYYYKNILTFGSLNTSTSCL